MSKRESAFEYEGYVYVRPVNRGVCLLETDREMYIEDAAPDGDGYYRMRLSYERLTDAEKAQAEAASNQQGRKGSSDA
jgi:hypothetical protein